MAFSTTIQHIEKPVSTPATSPSSEVPDALLGMLMLSVYGANMSKKSVRKLKRQFFLTTLKLKLKSFFKPQQRLSDRTLILVIAAVAFIALLIISPLTALVLALVLLILYLAGVI